MRGGLGSPWELGTEFLFGEVKRVLEMGVPWWPSRGGTWHCCCCGLGCCCGVGSIPAWERPQATASIKKRKKRRRSGAGGGRGLTSLECALCHRAVLLKTAQVINFQIIYHNKKDVFEGPGGGRRDGLGVRGWHMHNAVHGKTGQRGPAV